MNGFFISKASNVTSCPAAGATAGVSVSISPPAETVTAQDVEIAHRLAGPGEEGARTRFDLLLRHAEPSI